MEKCDFLDELAAANIDKLFLIRQLLDQFTTTEYTAPLPLLEGGTIGQHVRHILDFYQCLMQSMESGQVCYDHRKREATLESNPAIAIHRINDITQFLLSLTPDRQLNFHFSTESGIKCMETTLGRELMYAMEHTIHHSAIIRIAVSQVYSNKQIPETFGIAPSTIKFHQESVTHNEHLRKREESTAH